MPSQTTDLEDDISADLADGPLTLAVLIDRFGGQDPRWVAVALMHLRRDGKIRYTTCGADHNHSGDCAVEAVA